MISEDLKSKVDTLTSDERHELSAYLTKLELESNTEYWETIRRRMNADGPDQWVTAEDM